jgi:plastocyanin
MTLRRGGLVAVLLAGLALGASGCGDEGNADEPKEIVITNYKYDPEVLEIEVGDRVTFVNRSKGGVGHSANSEYGVDIDPSPGPGPTDHSGKDINYAGPNGFATHALFTDEPQTIVFRVARQYDYFCSFHLQMNGTIKVRPKDG